MDYFGARLPSLKRPGTGEAINTVPGGLTNEELLMDLGKRKHDRANLVSVQVRGRSENAETRAEIEVGVEQREV